MAVTLNSAKLAGQILRAMETGSSTRLRERLDFAAAMQDARHRESPIEEEQREVLSAIAGQMRAQSGPSEVHVRLLRHFASTVHVSLS
jgi:hypothetical protein